MGARGGFASSLFGLWLAACGGNAVIDLDSDGAGGGSGTTTSSGTVSTGTGSTGSGTSTTSTSGTGGATTTSSSSSSSGSGGSGGCPANAGACSSDAECFGQRCVELTSCGYRVCEQLISEATSCSTSFDECCESSECTNGRCFAGPFGAQCGGIQPPGNNVCAVDECQVATDCPVPPPSFFYVCTPPMTMGSPARSCVLGGCRTDGDCNAEPGGTCGPVQTACCSGPVGLYCSYPSDGCLRPSDCMGNSHCDIDGVRARCMSGPALCPP